MINLFSKIYPYIIIVLLYLSLFYVFMLAWKDNIRRDRELRVKENEQILLEQFWIRFLRNRMGYK